MTATFVKCLCGLALASAAMPALAAAPAAKAPGVAIPAGLRAALAHALQTHGSAQQPAPSASSWIEQKVNSSDGMAGDVFGFSVAIDGDTALIGAAQGPNGDGGADDGLPGAVYVFKNTVGGWVEVQKLTPDDGVADDQFGYTVALQGSTALVGAPFAAIGDNVHQGAVYVFTLDGDTWSQSQKLGTDDGATSDQLGWSVAIDGDTALLGAPGTTDGGDFATGAVYAFTRNGGDFTQAQKLTADDGVGSDDFGWAIAMQGDTAIITSPNSGGGTGSGYVFTSDGTSWTQASKLLADDGVGFDTLGYSAALDGDIAVLGAPFSNGFEGSVYAFTPNGDGTWSQSQKIVADETPDINAFGTAVSLSDGELVATAPFYDGSHGEAFLFSNGGSGDFVQQQMFTPGDGNPGLAYAYGYSCAISHGTFVIGAIFWAIDDSDLHQGAAYFYSQDTIFENGFDG